VELLHSNRNFISKADRLKYCTEGLNKNVPNPFQYLFVQVPGKSAPVINDPLFKLLWDLEVSHCEYVAAMGGFIEGAKRCSAIGPSDPDTLQNLKFATSIQARALATYNRPVDQVLKLTLFGEESAEDPQVYPKFLTAEQLLEGLHSGEVKWTELINFAGEVAIIDLAKLRDILLQHVNRGAQEKCSVSGA
jgi:hypothetical protein